MGKGKEHNKHTHHHRIPVNENNLLLTILLNLVITVAEIAGGLVSNSLALLSDALHNLSDTFSSFIAFLANRIGKKKADQKRTFGYKRIEIIAATLNAVILIVVCVYLFKEAYERILHPQPVKSLIMIIVAMIGLGANILAVILLRRDAKKSINIKAAYIHLIGDSLSSIVVVFGAAAIQFWKIYWIDPVITILIGIYLIRESFVILKETMNILMQGSPSGMNLEKIKDIVEELPEINNLHHLHVWNLNDNEIHLEAHVELTNDMKLNDLKPVRKKIEKLLKSAYHIHHMTIQFEYDPGHSRTMISNSG